MTETGLSLGTPHYMSPEQATAEKESSARSDVYSLGSVLYEMLTGQPPHLGGSAQQIIMKIITTPADLVTTHRKSVPPNVAGAVAKSLENLPADRFKNAKAFAEALGNPAYTNATVQGRRQCGQRYPSSARRRSRKSAPREASPTERLPPRAPGHPPRTPTGRPARPTDEADTAPMPARRCPHADARSPMLARRATTAYVHPAPIAFPIPTEVPARGQQDRLPRLQSVHCSQSVILDGNIASLQVPALRHKAPTKGQDVRNGLVGHCRCSWRSSRCRRGHDRQART